MPLPAILIAGPAVGNAPTTITIASSSTTVWDVGTAKVYIRTNRGVAWVQVTDLWPTEVVWCASPSMPTATLIWHYGRQTSFSSTTFSDVLRKTGYERKYVAIDLDCEPTGPGT